MSEDRYRVDDRMPWRWLLPMTLAWVAFALLVAPPLIVWTPMIVSMRWIP